MWPITTRFSGGLLPTPSGGLLLAKLLEEPRRRRRKNRAFLLPMGQTLAIDAQRFEALGRFRIVKAEALDEATVARAARIRHDDVEERPFLGAPAGKPYHYHGCLPL